VIAGLSKTLIALTLSRPAMHALGGTWSRFGISSAAKGQPHR